MKTLPVEFKKNGFQFTQVVREGNVAIYRQSKGTSNVHFEVGRIRENKEREQFGTLIPAYESWPSSEEWGSRAWTYPDLAGAKTRMATLIPPNSANL